MAFTFDGANKLIILTAGTTSFTAQEIYSRWKDWVLTSDNSKYEIAFTSVAGDPISDTQIISPYIFLNTTAGWRIRPQEADHTLSITGNLYSVDPALPLFTPTIGDYTVFAQIDRSAASITTTVGASGIDETTVRNAMTAQGYTTTRAPKIDNLDAAISTRAMPGQGLTAEQAAELEELFKATILAAGEVTVDVTDPLHIQTNIVTTTPNTFVGFTLVFEFIPSGRRRARVIKDHNTSGLFDLIVPVGGLPTVGTKVWITSEWNNITFGRMK